MKSKIYLVIVLLVAIIYVVVGWFSIFSACIAWKYIAAIILVFDGIVCVGLSIYALYRKQ